MVMYLTRLKMFKEGQCDEKTQPMAECPGGGMNAKAWNLLRAIDVELVDKPIARKGGIALLDVLAMHPDGEKFNEIVQEILEWDVIKILWAEEQEFLRWSHQKRLELISATDIMAVSNLYLQSILNEFDIDTKILYTPIDSTFYKPAKTKKPRLVAVGQVSWSKNTDGIIELFTALKDTEIECVFIGNAHLWGKMARSTDSVLESQLEKCCTWISSASRTEMAELLGEAWGFVSMSRYDVGSLSFLESAMAGCHCFAWNTHPQFDEYKHINRFDAVEDGTTLILDKFNETRDKPNRQIRNEVMKKHSFESFTKSLAYIIGDVYLEQPGKIAEPITPSEDNKVAGERNKHMDNIERSGAGVEV